MSSVRLRRIRFEYPADTDPMWTPHRPEFACAANAVSLMMPALEPYFMRAVRAGRDGLDDGTGQLVETYMAQEGQHFAQHLRFNRFLTDRYRGVARLERATRATYRWLERSRSTEFSLAFVASSELMAYSAARWAADRRRDLFDDADEVTSSLFLWHLAEEVEHKSVAHDVYHDTVDRSLRSTLSYLGATTVGLALMTIFVLTGTTLMLAGERRLANPIAWARLTVWAIGFAFELSTNLVWSLSPSFHPDRLTDPAFYLNWLDDYDIANGTLPLWQTADSDLPSQAPKSGCPTYRPVAQ